MGSYYYGYILTQVPGGWLAEKWGGKGLCGYSMLGISILNLLTPVMVRCSVGLMIASQVLQGILEVSYWQLVESIKVISFLCDDVVVFIFFVMRN